ncbi:hypothetical protein [Streptomyces sp. NPDC051211]
MLTSANAIRAARDDEFFELFLEPAGDQGLVQSDDRLEELGAGFDHSLTP